MEILFKDNKYVHILRNDRLEIDSIEYHQDNLDNIKHLDEAEVLYHRKNINNGETFPIYYEHDTHAITKAHNRYTWLFIDGFAKDYTLVNLNLI